MDEKFPFDRTEPLQAEQKRDIRIGTLYLRRWVCIVAFSFDLIGGEVTYTPR